MSLSRIALIRFVLRMTEPGGVGVPAPPDKDAKEAKEAFDLAVDRDPWGNPHLPGTTLAGGLRALVHGYTDRKAPGTGAGTAVVDRLFGSLLVRDTTRDTVDATASRIWILGSRLIAGDDTGSPTKVPTADEATAEGATCEGATADRPGRQRTAIDRRRGAARNHTLRRTELLPAGTRFEVFLRWDNPDAGPWNGPDTGPQPGPEPGSGTGAEPGAKPGVETGAESGPNASGPHGSGELAEFLAHLAGWRPLVGHGVTVGQGRCQVDEVGYRLLDLRNSADLLLWLTHDGPDLHRLAATEAVPVPVPADAGRTAPLRIGVRITGPFRIGTGPAVPVADCGETAAKMLRDDDNRLLVPGSTIKGILRSRCEYILRSLDAQPQVCDDQRCGRCWPCEMFGHGGGDDPNAVSVGRRGRLRFTDAPITLPAPGPGGRGPIVKRTHVAIDRFTGGARDKQLFKVEAVEAGSFTITLEPLDLTDERSRQLKAMLRLVMADLDDGLTGIGGGVHRGYGSVRIDLAEAERAGTLPTVDEARVVLADLLAAGVTA